jgi:hypothetical protein
MVGRWVLLDTGIALRTINNVRLTARFLNVAPDRGVAFIRYSRRRLDSRSFEHHVQVPDEYHVQITSEYHAQILNRHGGGNGKQERQHPTEDRQIVPN